MMISFAVDAMATRFPKVVVIFFLCLLHIPGTSSGLMLKFNNSCDDPIWVVIRSKPHSPELISDNMTGFPLRPGESKTVLAPDNWAGTVWARTHCKTDATGKFTCGTGDCGSYAVECPGGAFVPAATTFADFTPNGGVGEYTYFVSLEKGFNLPVAVVPRGTKGGDGSSYCRGTGCVADLNKECPKEVQVVLIGNNNSVIGCNSACEAFKESQDHYCGRASTYSDHFKGLCPNAQAFENDKTSNTTFECSSADHYVVHFGASSFPSTPRPPPPPSRSYRTASPDEYDNIPGEEELTDDSGTSSRSVIKIVGAVIGSITGVGALLILLVHAFWSLNHRDHYCPLCKLKCIFNCCNNWVFHCCNSSNSDPNPHPKHGDRNSTPKQKGQV